MADRVLVSGGTGFLGKRTVLELLDRGYDVRTTVRDLASEDTIRTDLAAAGIAPGNRLEVVAANLTSDEGWPEAAADCRFVLHIASPFPPEQPKDPDELIVPAREGAKRALAAALDAGAERVVLTSSVAAIHANRQDSEAQPLNEDDWTDGDDTSRIPYTRSKTLAERAAWALAEEKGVVTSVTRLYGDGLDALHVLRRVPRLPWWTVVKAAQRLGVGPRGPVVFECVGVPGVIDDIVTHAPFLSRVVVVGVCMEPDTFRHTMAVNKELDLRFSFCYDPVEFRETLHLVADGTVDPRPLITDVVGLDGVAAAFEALGSADEQAKILIDPQG